MKKYITSIMAGLMVTATGAFAGTQATNANTVAPTLQVSATIQTAVRLTLATGTVAAFHCTVNPGGGDYQMDFGTVDALGINNGLCNKFAPTTPGTSDAVYWSDYSVTPVYTSHATIASTTVTARVTSDFAAPNNIYVVRDTANSAAIPGGVGAMTAMGVASADVIASAPPNGTAFTRYIGVGVKPTNGVAGLTGAQSATVTFTLTVN